MPPLILHIAGDESGSLTNPYSPVVTATAIMTYNPLPLRWIITKAKRSVRKESAKRGRVSEFKFYTTTDVARGNVLSSLAQEDVSIVSFSIQKGAQVIPDTPENYGILLCNLLKRSVGIAPQNINIVFDNHYSRSHKREALNALIRDRLLLNTDIRFVDSRKNTMVQLADFVAGATNYAHTGKATFYYNLIRSRIVGDEIVSWKDARREWLEWKNKNDRYR